MKDRCLVMVDWVIGMPEWETMVPPDTTAALVRVRGTFRAEHVSGDEDC